MRQVLISPSVMCANLWHLKSEIEQLEAAEVDFLHIDIMDAHFVPNMPVGLELLSVLRKHTSIPLDVHLMVDKNDLFIDLIEPMEVKRISLHLESEVHLDRSLDKIRKLGVQAGVALNPSTSLIQLQYILERLDFIVLMTVNPGFSGQKVVPSANRKIFDCRKFIDGYGLDIPIQVDGNVSLENIPAMVASGADILVCGTSSIFRSDGNIQDNTKRTREAIARGLEIRNQGKIYSQSNQLLGGR